MPLTAGKLSKSKKCFFKLDLTCNSNAMMNKKMNNFGFINSIIFAILFLITATASANALFTAKVDRNTLSLQETLSLTLRYHEQVILGEPDLAELEQNFDILNRHRNQQYRSVNGRAESWTQWKLTLAPKQEGRLLIPSFAFRKSFTDAIEVQVNKVPVVSSNSNDQPIFMEAVLEKDSVYVQEQIFYTIRLLTSVDLNGLDTSDLDVKNAVVKKTSENQYQKNINGRNYGVVEVTYAIFPQQSGTISIPSSLWTVMTKNTRGRNYDPYFNSGGKRINLRTPVRNIDVMPQPNSFDGQNWLPVQAITLEQKWGTDPNSFIVGEPITRTITVKAKGLSAAQVPPLTLDEIDGLSYYPDQPQTDEQISAQGVTSIRNESYAIVANKPGKLILPAITIKWWDTKAKKARESYLPVEEITVTGIIAKQTPVTIPQPSIISETSKPQITPPDENTLIATEPRTYWWIYLSVFNGLLALIFLGLWLKRNASQKTSASDAVKDNDIISTKQAYQRLQLCLNEGEPSDIRSALIEWGNCHFSGSNIHNLMDLTSAINDPEFNHAAKTLDDHLYGHEDQRIPPALIDSIRQSIKKLLTKNKQVKEGLEPLYS